MELYVLRNGEAGAHSPDVPAEFHRPLSDAGRSEVEEVARWMADRGVQFDVIVSSPLPRAKQTAEIVAGTVHYENQIMEWKDLEPGIAPDIVLAHLTQFYTIDHVLLVGHEPDISTLISRLIAGHPNCNLRLHRAGLAKLRNLRFFEAPKGELQWLLTPEMMKSKAAESHRKQSAIITR